MAQSKESLKFEAETAKPEQKSDSETASELNDLKKDVLTRLACIKDTFGEIVSDVECVKYNESGFQVGKESVQPLVELKAAATEILNSVQNNNPAVFEQEIDLDPFAKHINDMKKQNMQARQLVSYLNSSMDGITKLMEQQKKQKENGNSSESCSSVVTSSEPSVSEFNIFVNRNNVVTSSPLPSETSDEQQKD